MPQDDPSHNLSETAAVCIVAHPPERGRRLASVPAQAGPGCCCCCCCCLHSLGAIIGASMASNSGGGPEPRGYLPLLHYWDEESDAARPWTASPSDREAVTRGHGAVTDQGQPAPPVESFRTEDGREISLRKPSLSAVRIFWWMSLILVFGGLILMSGSEGPLFAVVVGLLILPAIQLGAAFVTAIIVSAGCEGPDKSYQLRQLGKLTGGLVAGAVVGILVMVAIWAVFFLR
jgi:hypothetical protein